MPDRVGPAHRRQSTTYYSSSDAVFPDRDTIDRDYQHVIDGTVALEGGWRVYSSGPGLYLRLVLECPLGIRRRGWVVEVAYRVGPIGSGPTRVTVGGHMLDAQRLENPYRTGGLSVQADDLHRLLGSEGARIDVEVS